MSAEPDIDQLYERHIKALPRATWLRLLARIADELAGSDEEKTLSIMGLHGLGADIWRGIDAQAYVNKLRDEWGNLVIKLDDALATIGAPGFDTAPIIYFVEKNPRYDALVTAVFQRVANGDLRGVTSVISLSEVLVHPLSQGNTQLSDEYRNLLLNSRDFSTLPIDATVAESAAGLRARYGLRTPDALQIATALNAGCAACLTNDTRLAAGERDPRFGAR